MGVRLLGTGAADGWPSAFCGCASCTAERAAGRVRAQAAALVDEALLLDCGPTTPWAAERLGVPLAGVRLLLLTHQHTDHCSPATLMHRSWVSDAPLTVLGPPEVITACRPWLPDDQATVVFRPVRPGEELELEGYRIRVVAAAHRTGLGAGDPEAVLYDVHTPAGERVLYATDTGPLPEESVAAVRGAAFDVVLLEETFGDRTDHGTDHLDLDTFPAQLSRLRAVGAVTAGTRVVATHLSHHNPPTDELARRLADWGAEVYDDGAVLGARPRPADRPSRTLVLGGARSGKSREAERILADATEVTYVATGYPPGADAEWAERVARHRERRPASWRTEETLDLTGLLGAEGGPLLVDCLTLWLTRILDRHRAWDDPAAAESRVLGEIDTLVTAWRGTARRVVAVGNEVGQGIAPADPGTRLFRDLMGRLNAALAAETEDVRFCVAGRVLGC